MKYLEYLYKDIFYIITSLSCKSLEIPFVWLDCYIYQPASRKRADVWLLSTHHENYMQDTAREEGRTPSEINS